MKENTLIKLKSLLLNRHQEMDENSSIGQLKLPDDENLLNIEEV